jgi:hypothetical protein
MNYPSTDFETHPRGTIEEIRASRKLANAIELVTRSYGHGIIPGEVWNAYCELSQVYNKHMLNGDV